MSLEIEIKCKDYCTWQKRTTEEASDEPIINKEDNFKINFSF